MLRSCFLLREELQQGAVLVLQNLPVLHVAPGQSFCCICPSSISEIFTDHDLTEGWAGHQPDCHLQPLALPSVEHGAQVPADQTGAIASTPAHTAAANSQLTASHSAAIITDCTVPVETASLGMANTGIPILRATCSPSADTEAISSTALRAVDIFRTSSYSQQHYQCAVVPASQHVNSKPARSEPQAPAQVPQPLSQRSAQFVPELPLIQPATTSLVHSRVLPNGTSSQHAGHDSKGAAICSLNGGFSPSSHCSLRHAVEGSCNTCLVRADAGAGERCQSDGGKPPRGWVENLKQHIRRKQLQAAPAGTACALSLLHSTLKRIPQHLQGWGFDFRLLCSYQGLAQNDLFDDAVSCRDRRHYHDLMMTA